MARRAFDVIDVVEVLQHWHAGRPKAGVAASLGVDREDGPQVRGAGGGGGLVPGGPPLSRAEWAELVRGLVPRAGRREGAQPDVPGDQRAPRPDRGDAGDEHGDHGASAAARRARPGGEHRRASGVTCGSSSRRPAGAGEQVTVLRPPVDAGRGSPDRLRLPGVVARPDRRAGAAGVGVRDGAGVLPAHVRAPGAVDGPAAVGGRACRRVRVLRRGARPGWCPTT